MSGAEVEPAADPVVALIPAAGRGTRLPHLPCSKEIYPLSGPGGPAARPRAVCEHLLEALDKAAIGQAFVILRPGKWDVPTYLDSRDGPGPALAYLTIEDSPSVPHTLDRAFPFVADRRVALGFPDILFEPADAFVHLVAAQRRTAADLALALFPTRHPERADMVDHDAGGAVRRLLVKRPDAGLRYTWSAAVWTPRFTGYLHDFVRERGTAAAGERELYLGDVIQAAIEDGMTTTTVRFPAGDSLDVGVPEDLRRAARRLRSRGRDR